MLSILSFVKNENRRKMQEIELLFSFLIDGIVHLATTSNKIGGIEHYEMARAYVHKFIVV